MKLEVVSAIDSLDAREWNRLAGDGFPFFRHEFLAALEHHDCVGERYGWIPRHLAAFAEDGSLIGAVPLYFKDNSYGEFVFDWAWADAYHRQGLAYYPKAVVAAPYTPATGPRILTHPEADRATLVPALIELARSLSHEQQLSSLHWLFTDSSDTRALREQGFMLRLGCQFHWTNQDYGNFDDFLVRLNSRKRKRIKRERRHVEQAEVELRILHGHEMTHDDWRVMHAFYCSTFEKKSGMPTLSLAFFEEISRTMGENIVLVFAYHQGQAVAGAINFKGEDTLYGRHWGCHAEFNSLHFEACYYQGIEYCIRHGLKRFEPGAQGEHKISRGFLPTETWSAHWVAHEGFRHAVDDFLKREQRAMTEYIDVLNEQSPYRQETP